jgi:hypothetical protein
VELYPSLADLTQVDQLGVRKVAPGEYTFKFGVQETVNGGGGRTLCHNRLARGGERRVIIRL